MGAAAVLFLLLAGPATAVDGVLEINHACATATGCFAGDGSNFPVQIGASGSYRLTSDLTLPNGNTTAVQVLATAESVSIDLNGFRIACPVCGPGSGDGIDAATGVRLAVRDGNIFSVGGSGIDAIGPLVVERVTVAQARAHGIRTSGSARVSDCTVEESSANGVDVGPESILTRLVVRNSGQIGVFIGSGIVSQSSVFASQTLGIQCDTHCAIHGNLAAGNGEQGVLADHSNLQRNVVAGGGDFGIDSYRSLVHGNTMSGNDRQGLNAGQYTGYGKNHLEDNNSGGSQVSLGIQIDANGCGTGLCP